MEKQWKHGIKMENIKNGENKQEFAASNAEILIPHTDLVVRVERKPIKHTHLYVFPPDARILVSAPIDITESDIQSFLISKVTWIRKQIAAIQSQPRETYREYESGENVYLFGKRYRLLIKKSSEEPKVHKEGKNIVVSGRGLESRTARETRILEWYRTELKQVLIKLIARFASILGEEREISFEVRKMRNMWGSCSSQKCHIRFNLALARVPIRCIEYVVMHELVHLTIPNHSFLFERELDKHFPRWREARKELNNFVAQPLVEK